MTEQTLKRARELVREVYGAHEDTLDSFQQKRFEEKILSAAKKLDAWAQEARLEEAKVRPHDADCIRYAYSGDVVDPPCDCSRGKRIGWLEQRIAEQPHKGDAT